MKTETKTKTIIEVDLVELSLLITGLESVMYGPNDPMTKLGHPEIIKIRKELRDKLYTHYNRIQENKKEEYL